MIWCLEFRRVLFRSQRLAAPAKVYVEQFTAHPLERDAAKLYAPPDGYLDKDGQFHKDRRSPDDKPVFEVTLSPDDGLYPMPYMARQAHGRAWEEECADPLAPQERAPHEFYPHRTPTFEELLHLCTDP